MGSMDVSRLTNNHLVITWTSINMIMQICKGFHWPELVALNLLWNKLTCKIHDGISVCKNWCSWIDCMEWLLSVQGLTLSIWFTCPSGTWFWKLTCPAKIFTCPANICTSPVKLMYTAGKIMTCPDLKITCPVGHVTTKVYMPWDKIYMPRACGHALMSSPAVIWRMMIKIHCIIWVWLDSRYDLMLFFSQFPDDGSVCSTWCLWFIYRWLTQWQEAIFVPDSCWNWFCIRRINLMT